jgi:hypothetical protein
VRRSCFVQRILCALDELRRTIAQQGRHVQVLLGYTPRKRRHWLTALSDVGEIRPIEWACAGYSAAARYANIYPQRRGPGIDRANRQDDARRFQPTVTIASPPAVLTISWRPVVTHWPLSYLRPGNNEPGRESFTPH